MNERRIFLVPGPRLVDLLQRLNVSDHVLVAKVKGAEKESFVFVTLRSDFSAIMRMSYPALTEDDLWATLHKMGMPDHEIKAAIEDARSHPI